MKRFLSLCLVPDSSTNSSRKSAFKSEARRLSARLAQDHAGYYNLTQSPSATKLSQNYSPYSILHSPVCFIAFDQQKDINPFIRGVKDFMGKSLDLTLNGIRVSGLEDVWDYYSILTDGKRRFEATHTKQRKVETIIQPNDELLTLRHELCALIKNTLGEDSLISPADKDYRPSVLLWADFHHANNKKLEIPWDLLDEQSKTAPFRLVLGTIQPLGHMTAFTENHVMVRQASTLVLT